MTGADIPVTADHDEQAAGWCVALAFGELTQGEQAAFDAWIADAANAAAFADATRTWEFADAAAATPELIAMRGAALDDYRKANQRRWSARNFRHPWWAAIAAAMILVIGGALWLRGPTDRFSTGIGERRVAMLRDGSRLTLDADSEVDVRWLADRRILTLVRGRAKFDVARDPLRPFSVAAGDKMVVATGTSFSVEMLARQMHVMLYEGHVAVLQGRDHRPVAGALPAVPLDQQLIPGRELVTTTAIGGPARVRPIDITRSLSWEKGQLSFDDEPLESAIERMNRYSDQKLAFGGAGAGHLRVSGVFVAGDNEAFAEGVAEVDRLDVARQGDTIVLGPRPE